MTESPDYLPENIREKLIHDPRVAEQDLKVDVKEHRVLLGGNVATSKLRHTITEVAQELLPGYEIVNETTVVPALALTVWTAPAVAAPADAVYVNAYVYTVDARESVREALAVRDGRIAYVGSNAGARALAGSATRVVDVQQHLLMPGLVDGHMHPLQGGTALLKCNLNYERLTVAQMQARIQACLDQTQAAEPDKWLEVVNWFREAMLPNGVATTRATLDGLKTRRPIFVMSSFVHTALVNTRALQLA